MSMKSEARIVTPAYLWFDAEFTGLDAEHARLLQVALVITDATLTRLTAPEKDVRLCIKLEPDVPVSAWVAENLADLLRQCRSEQAVSLEEADVRLSASVDEVVGPVATDIKRRPVLAGNTVHMDLTLVRRFLPLFSHRLHYRLLDVSAVKILWNDWFSEPVFDKGKDGWVDRHLPAGIEPPPARAHDAYYDVHASLAELNYYRRRFLQAVV